MRGILVKCVSILMTLSYLVAIGGLDVHSDHESGQIYVRMLSAGISCEDIHPDSPCHHNHTEGCGEDEDCCSDNILVLSITGDDNSSDDLHISSGVSFCAVMPCISFESGQSFCEEVPALCFPRGIPPKLLLHRICVMRV